MPRNAAGVYSLPEAPVVAGTTIEPTPENSTRDDIAAELTSSLDRAGRGAMIAGLKIVDGSLGTPGLNFASDADNGIYRTGVNTWHLVAAGAVVVTFGPGVVSIPGTVVFSMNTPLAVASGGTGAATAAAARTALDVPSNAEAVLKADSAITVPRVNTLIIDSNAAVDISLRTNNGTEQVQINHVASANRSLVLSGSNGGNPTIGVTAGSIGLTTDTVVGGVLTANSLRGASSALMSPITNSLGADVALNNTANYFDGPSVAQGTAGTWFVSGHVQCSDNTVAADFYVKLWDGTTLIASGHILLPSAGNRLGIHLSGFITSPAGNLRISVRDPSSVSGFILYNQSGNAKDCTITAIRIA